MSTRSSSVDKKDVHEKEFLRFLLKRLKNAGGAMQLQQITEHMVKLPYDVMSTVGTSRSDVLYFLRKHSNVFSEKNNIVKIIGSSTNGGYDSDSSGESQPALPTKIEKGKGVVIKIFSRYGFIKAKEPVKTIIYFRSFDYGHADIDLTSCLYIGAMVYFNAKKKNDTKKSKYCATKVWKVDESDSSSIVVQKSRKNRDSGVYDPLTLDDEGIIQNVFPNIGFITVKGDANNTVFFHKNRLLKYDNIVDLTKVLSKGDRVEFSAHRTTKPDAKARWEATKVWKKSSQIKETHNSTESDKSHGNRSLLSKIGIGSKHSPKEMIKNQRGKICPRSQGAVIKFGQNELADGDASVYYISGCEVKDISWEFCEGDNVFFDAVKIKSAPGWKAVLVWVGEKPDIVLPTCVGDFSQFTDDETEDNLSNYMSYSSNSSVKSEYSSSKNRKMKKDTSNQSNSSVNIDKRINKKENLHPSYSSQSSLNSYVTPSSHNSKKKHKDISFNKGISAKNKIVSCWGDSPYPDDDNNNIAADSYDYNLPSMSNHKKVPKITNEVHRKMKHLDSSVENNNKKYEIPESEAEETIGNVKTYKCIAGEITKVYSKFAEVKTKAVESTFSFYWNHFYVNGKSVEELELDDLKQVLKIGDKIHFNYFEIIDDSGQMWNKVSLAWKGSKPMSVIEVTPESFIKQNDLSVSMTCQTAVKNEEEDNTQSRKFLTAVTDLEDDELTYKTSSESCAEDKLNISPDDSYVLELPNKIDVSEMPSRILSSVDYKIISSAVTEILKKDLFSSTDAEVDFDFITEEILNVVLENRDLRKCDDKFCQTSFQDENVTSNKKCENCEELLKSNSNKNVNTEHSEVQTIITGEIIAQSIFTDS